jgi:hypothetical protein
MTVLIVLAAIVVGVALWMAPSGVALCTEGETSIARNSLRGRRSRAHRPPHKATMPQATCCRGSRPAPAGSSGWSRCPDLRRFLRMTAAEVAGMRPGEVRPLIPDGPIVAGANS